jgi:hypothetical protein
MCFPKLKTPKVVQRDPVAEQAKAQAEAQGKANAETAAKRRKRAANGGGVAAAAVRAANLGGGSPSLLAPTQARQQN